MKQTGKAIATHHQIDWKQTQLLSKTQTTNTHSTTLNGFDDSSQHVNVTQILKLYVAVDLWSRNIQWSRQALRQGIDRNIDQMNTIAVISIWSIEVNLTAKAHSLSDMHSIRAREYQQEQTRRAFDLQREVSYHRLDRFDVWIGTHSRGWRVRWKRRAKLSPKNGF